MGTARIAADEDEGVCASDGSVHGVDDLYVADASLFPTSVGVNPMMTVIAFAKQIAAGARATEGRMTPPQTLKSGSCRSFGEGSSGPPAQRSAVRRWRWRRRLLTEEAEVAAWRRRRLAAEAAGGDRHRSRAVGGVAEGDPFFVHRAVAPVGDPTGGDQAEEDAELSVASTETPPKLAEARRVDDAEEDQQHRDHAEHGDDGAHRDRRLGRRVGEAQPGHHQRRDDRDQQHDRDEVERVPGVAAASPETLPEKPLTPETSTPNQSKNMKMKSRIAETAAIFSPGLSLSSVHLCIPPVELGVGATLHPGSGGSQRIYEQHRDRHRPDPAGHRRDRRGDLGRGLEVDVADRGRRRCG